MIFKGIENQTVEFKITNYEFPENTTYTYDSNWLLIYLNINSNCGKWETVDPALLTEEIKEIIEWFENLSNNLEPESKQLTFIESNIVFELKDYKENLKKVKIIFNQESLPKNADDKKEYYVECQLNNKELKTISENLKKEFKPFPTRDFE